MNLLPFVLTVTAVLAMASLVLSVVHLIAADGLGVPHMSPPRSHHDDLFEPHRCA